MNIFNTDIITSEQDTLWADVSGLMDNLWPKPLLVITNEYKQGSNEEDQLKKMLEAEKSCNLRSAQYNIICFKEGQQAAWYQLREKLDPKIVLLIGVLPSQLGIAALFVINSSNSFDDRIWLPTVSLCLLEQNLAVKSQLWNNGMKPILKDNKYGLL